MSSVYGKRFARVYDAHWHRFSERLWPFLWVTVRKHAPHALSWLDLCCGNGSLLKLASVNGFRVVGLDRSPHQLDHARRNAPGAWLVQDDVRSFALRERFDVVTCLYDSLNYLTLKADLRRAFRRTVQHLNPNGVFIFDVNTLEGLRGGWQNTSVRHEKDCTVIIETSFDPRRGIGRCLITGFVREGKVYRRFQEEHVQRAFKAEIIKQLIEEAGLRCRKYDGRTLGRARKRSGRLVYVCWKK